MSNYNSQKSKFGSSGLNTRDNASQHSGSTVDHIIMVEQVRQPVAHTASPCTPATAPKVALGTITPHLAPPQSQTQAPAVPKWQPGPSSPTDILRRGRWVLNSAGRWRIDFRRRGRWGRSNGVGISPPRKCAPRRIRTWLGSILLLGEEGWWEIVVVDG